MGCLIRPSICWGAVGLVIGVIVVALGGEGYAADLAVPRYRWEVGQRLTYDSSSSFKYQNGSFDNENQWTITIVGKNNDGSFRAILMMASGTKQNREGAKTPTARKDRSCGYADIDTAGNVNQLFDSFGYRLEPSSILPKLPESEQELANGWQTAGPFDAVISAKVLPESNANKLVFETTSKSPEDAIYGTSNRRVVFFDRLRGLVEGIESTNKQTYGFKGEGAGEVKLVGIEQCDADELKRLTADAEQFFPAKQKFSEAAASDAVTAESLDAAADKLQKVAAQLQTDQFRDLAKGTTEQFARTKEYAIKEAAERKELLEQPAYEFKTVDLAGKPHALTDYRGKVVLLDFWYRGCGWCIRCMPQLNEVAEHYRNRPVALLGMNTDSKVEDANFVVDKMGLQYPQLKAEELPKEYKVQGFPTLIVIDQQGKIRHVHSGWTPTLKADLIAKIDELLAEGK